MNPRVSWNDLPVGLRGRIEDVIGAFVREEHIGTGHNCLVGMALHTTHGEFFVKGVRADHARAVWTQANEAAVNEYLRPVTPALTFHLQAERWDILGFEYLAGYRHADLSPGSPDLTRIAGTLQTLSELPAPADMQLRTIEDRWHDYGDQLSLLTGSTLAHTDLHRHNIMIGDSAKLIDWAWPTLAAPWIDTACVGLQLICAGHHPEDAERWCRQLSAYSAASDEAVSAFVGAARGLWNDISSADPRPWKLEVAAAARRWALYRGL